MADESVLNRRPKQRLNQLLTKPPVSFSTAIVAGGKSSRMKGRNKAFLTCNETPYIEKIINIVNDLDDVMISTRTDELYKYLGKKIVLDETPRIGPIGGLYSCLRVAKNDVLLFLAVDMPNVSRELINYLLEFYSSDYDVFVFKSGEVIHPFCGLYKKTILPQIQEMIKNGNYRLSSLLTQVNTKIIDFSTSKFSPFLLTNTNTPEEYAKLNRPFVFCVSGLKNSGKTTMITKLIRIFKEHGLNVGNIKHDGHNFTIDHKGTDTFRYIEEGSDYTLIYSDQLIASIEVTKKPQIKHLINRMQSMDVIIIEGLKHSHFPKIEMVLEHCVCDESTLLAVATDGSFTHPRVPTFKRNDADALSKLLLKHIL